MAPAITQKSIAKFVIIGIIAVGSCLCTDGHQNELPDCDFVEETRSKTEPIGSLLLVSTLDGRLTAVDSLQGDLKWELNTGSGALLASTIKQLQMSRDGQWSHIVHSLEGDLFTLGGDSIQPIPLRIDDLLSASLKVTDDTVITCGKEIRTFGVLPSSGQVRYSCSVRDCQKKYANSDKGEEEEGPVLVVRRRVQTVRAICPLTGTEKWNFSVGNHEVALVGNFASGCHTTGERRRVTDLETSVQFIAPEGTVLALNPSDSSEFTWKREFSSPIAHAWILEDGNLKSVDLFENAYRTPMIGEDGRNHDMKPAVYVGTYQDVLYLQRSRSVREQDVLYKQNLIDDKSGHFSKVAWKPFFLTKKSMEPWLIAEEQTQVNDNTALIIREARDVIAEDGSFYLFALPPVKGEDTKPKNSRFPRCDVKSIWHGMFSNKKTALAILPNNSYPFGAKIIPVYNVSDDHPINITLAGSLWHWWKEILFISITFAISLNLLIYKLMSRRLRRKIKEENANADVKPVSPGSESSKPEMEIPFSRTTSETISTGSSVDSNFESRYLADFEPIQRLGKGGFGLVVEARNKIDDCHYAIKRICLPNREEARKKVMREVKALAKLDHVGIVRYYNAWLECPPAGWQEMKDRELAAEDSFTHGSLSMSCRRTVSVQGIVSGTWSFGDTSKDSEEESGSFSCASVKTDVKKTVSGCGDGQDSFIVFQDSGCEEKEGAEEDDCSTPRPTCLDPSGGLNPYRPTRVYLYIQMQLCQKESLRDWLVKNSEARDKQKLLDIFEQIVGAVEYVHAQGLMHRDLKPSNIFFAMDGTIKVGDFGLVTAMPEFGVELESPMNSLENGREFLNHTDQVGTQLYMSPEQIQKLPYDQKVDIFSLGLIFFEMLIPFATQMERQKILTNARQNVFPEEFAKIHPAECDMVKQLLAFNPDERPSANDIMDDPLLDGLRSSKHDGARRRSRTISQNCPS